MLYILFLTSYHKIKFYAYIMNVLIACEESQTICKAFRKLGHNAFSCDLKKCSGGKPEWHLLGDMFDIIEKTSKGLDVPLENGEKIVIDGGFELMIAHPPCTYLSVSGARWFYHPDDKDLPKEQRRPHPKFPNRWKDQETAIEFFMKVVNINIDKIAIENPIGVMSKKYRKPDQIIQPYMFGDEATKTTCLWLKNLPNLKPTKIVDKGERIYFSSGKSMPKWYNDALIKAKTTEERQTIRSKTFEGMANAMAQQWSIL